MPQAGGRGDGRAAANLPHVVPPKAKTGAQTPRSPVFAAGSRLGFGAWQIGGRDWGPSMDRRDAMSLVSRALELGITIFDTAPNYGASEEILGEALGSDRDSVSIATKVGPRDDPESSLQRSLLRLRSDYVDLLQLHEPGPDFERKMEGIAALKERGVANAVGLCNATTAQLRWAVDNVALDAYQAQYNLFDREAEQRHIPICRDAGVALIAYRALASGLVGSGLKTFDVRDHRGRIYWFAGPELPRRNEVLEMLEEIAVQKRVAVTALALAWALQRPDVSVVLMGARTNRQLEQNLDAVTLKLEPRDLAAIEGAVRKAFPVARASNRAIDESRNWGERERFIVARLDGNTPYEAVAATWNDSREEQLTTAQVRVFVDALSEQGLVSYE